MKRSILAFFVGCGGGGGVQGLVDRNKDNGRHFLILLIYSWLQGDSLTQICLKPFTTFMKSKNLYHFLYISDLRLNL